MLSTELDEPTPPPNAILMPQKSSDFKLQENLLRKRFLQKQPAITGETVVTRQSEWSTLMQKHHQQQQLRFSAHLIIQAIVRKHVPK
jgi:hypothetical protein